MRIAVSFAMFIVALGVSSYSSAAEEWKEFRSQEGRFSVLLPGTPTEGKESVDTALGPIEVHKFMIQVSSELACGVVYNDYPEAIVWQVNQAQLLDIVRDGVVQSVQGKLRSERKVPLTSSPVREIVVDVGEEGTIRARLYLVEQRGYQVMAITGHNKESSKDVEKFLDSFKLLGQTKAETSTDQGTTAKTTDKSTTAQTTGPRIPSALDGLYVSLTTSVAAGSDVDYLVFFPDGLVIWRLPQEGLDGFNRAASMKQSPNFWGTYNVNGNKLELRFPTGQRILTKDNEGRLMVVNETGYSPYIPMSKMDGVKLDGAYARERGFPAIAFAPDSTFRDDGAMNAVGLSPVLPDGTIDYSSFRQVPPGKGTYRIANNTLTLTYSSGNVVKISICATSQALAQKRPPTIILNTYGLSLQN